MKLLVLLHTQKYFLQMFSYSDSVILETGISDLSHSAHSLSILPQPSTNVFMQ